VTARVDIGCGDHVRWHPAEESPWGGMAVEGIAERVCERADGTRRLTMLHVTAVHRGTSLGDRGFALGSLVDVTVAPGSAEVLRRAYAPDEKMTDRHPDSVIAQVVEETIAKQVEFLSQPHPTLAAIKKSAPATPGKRWVTPVVYEDRPVPVVTTCPGYNATFRIDPDPPDLTPAPPRYPRTR